MLGVVVKHFGDTLGESDNESFLFTLNADGSNLQLQKKLNKKQELVHINRVNQYAVLKRITTTQYTDWVSQYSMVDLVTNEEIILKDFGSDDCRSYRIIPSLDGNYLAAVEAFSQSSVQSTEAGSENVFSTRKLETPISELNARSATLTPVSGFVLSSQHSNATCNPMALKITILDATTMQVVSDVQSNVADFSYDYYFDGPIEERVELFWIDSGLVVKDFVPSVADYALIDIAGNVYAATTDLMSCEVPVTSSGRVSGDGMLAEVFAFVGMSSAEIELTESANSNEETSCN